MPLSEEAVALLTALRAEAPQKARYSSALRAPRGLPPCVGSRACDRWCSRQARARPPAALDASLLVNAGYGLPVIGALLGHKTPATTARYVDQPHRHARGHQERRQGHSDERKGDPRDDQKEQRDRFYMLVNSTSSRWNKSKAGQSERARLRQAA